MKLIRNLPTCLSIAAALPLAGRAAEEKPNVIVILADDMGYGDAGFNGCKEISTPSIDSIAKNGIRFSAGYVTAPQCAPSRSGLLTGVDQNKIRCENNMVLDLKGLADGLTFADRMRAAGYHTGAIGKWHLGDQPGKHPLDRGFDEFFGFLGGSSFYYPKGQKTAANILEGREPVTWKRYLTDVFGDRAVKFIGDSKTQPFFLYLAFNAPHTPLQAPDEELDKFTHIADQKRRTYAAMLSVMDRNVGRVLDALKANGIDRKTIVVFLSDNGGPTEVTGADNKPLRGVKGDILEGGVRVPFALQWPGTVNPGQTVDVPVSSLDLLPTALAAAGQPVPSDLDGKNLLPALTGKESYPSRILTWRFPLSHEKKETWWWGIRDGNWKLVCFNTRVTKGITPATGLFDLDKDVGESNDLSSVNPEVRARLQKTYDAWAEKVPAPFSGLSPEDMNEISSAKSAKQEKMAH